MDETDYRVWRVRLRQVMSALMAESAASGAASETVGVMELVFDARQPAAGYVTPRRGTVWVPDSQIRAALDALQAAGGVRRVRLVDGLYPPRFITALRALGLRLADERPLRLLALDEIERSTQARPDARPVLTEVDRARWEAFPGPFSDPSPPGARDWLMSIADADCAAARFGATGDRAMRLIGWSAIGPAQDPASARLLLEAVGAAPALGADLLFSEIDAKDDHAFFRALGFRETGAVLTFEEGA